MTSPHDFVLSDSEGVLDERPTAAAREIPAGDCGRLDLKASAANLLRVNLTGPGILIAFNSDEYPDEMKIAAWRDKVFQLLQQHPNRKTVTFDLRGVPFLPSGMLGLLLSIKTRGCDVELANACSDIQEVLRVTRLDQLLLRGRSL
jgi:hypothetical protein